MVRSPDSTMFEIGVLLSNLHNRGGTVRGETVSTHEDIYSDFLPIQVCIVDSHKLPSENRWGQSERGAFEL